MSNDDVAREAFAVLQKALDGDHAAKQNVLVLHNLIQVSSPEWLDSNTPLWLVDIYPNFAVGVPFNNTN